MVTCGLPMPNYVSSTLILPSRTRPFIGIQRCTEVFFSQQSQYLAEKVVGAWRFLGSVA